MAALVLVATPILASSGASAAWPSTNPSWTNGSVLCIFQSSHPEVAVSADAVAHSGLDASIASVAEIDRGGAVVAVTDGAAANWNSTNRSTSDWYDLSYSATVPVTTLAPEGPVLGTTSLRIDFRLPVYASTPTTNLTSVIVQLALSGWPWQSNQDHLAIDLSFAPAFPTSEHLVASGSNAGELANAANGSGQTMERFAAAPNATVAGPVGPSISVGVTPTASVAASSAVIALAVDPSAGPFSSLNYTAQIGVVLPSTIAGLPFYDFVVVAEAGLLVAVGVGLGLRRARRSPSDLVYAEEEG